MFVMKTGTCQRPPLQWPQEVLAATVCFPYIVTLQPQVLSVYSMVDLQHKQSVNLQGVKGLLSTSGKQTTEKSFPSCNCSIILKRRCSCARQFAPIQSIILAPERFSKSPNKSPFRWCVSVHRERHFQPRTGAFPRANPGTCTG